MELSQKTIILGVTGGIAAYKSAYLVRLLTQAGATVHVVMTRAAQDFVGKTTFQALSGHPVLTDTIGNDHDTMEHIHLTRQADAIIIAPATANTIANLANGQAHDLLSAMCLAKGKCPLLIAPAMNHEMWSHPATQRNIQTLKQDGCQIFGPNSGVQACGENGPGRMLEPEELLAEIIAFFQPKYLSQKHVLITAGPTQEPIDPVRVISNLSSGQMGYALARAAKESGAKVTLISGPTALPQPYGVERINVHTAKQMYEAVMKAVDECDIFISVAAVADWYIKNYRSEKIKKSNQKIGLDLEFGENPDILASVAQLPHPPYCVGFAAETNDLFEHAQAKLTRKKIPMIIANLSQDAMNLPHTDVWVLTENEKIHLHPGPKLAVARNLINIIAEHYYQSLRSQA
ncbi:bifunctional phosphopantothenoylcysteine decarboxylase/phosphopantothenate--cysteine ligase CoaBC [Basilea psittacipulmonis]|uniref:Coenzyme A biosynthesis bifunctional protein CoaBC n=1 Tax=Basilea psittacipulmonis DSM 24701 TaxID=1072685 RepID=A0A077DFA3_9BURK|nr:bifunctional phosphopantothenoylcysteine decarboxylase/phosphopantothenate--cysteine ligase CoaBC [Basilea psittacipulmonis]AIL32801.1 phosphopantothenate synthase [Basilea psittacipulmonis DSM 24701]